MMGSACAETPICRFPNGYWKAFKSLCARAFSMASRGRKAGGIDLQVLGIGPNGHVAFNEPGSAFDSRTRVVTLTDETRRHNAYSFGSFEKVPDRAITMGIDTILEAKGIVLLANGPEKADVLTAAILESPSESLPASALQTYGAECTIIADRAAAAGLLR